MCVRVHMFLCLIVRIVCEFAYVWVLWFVMADLLAISPSYDCINVIDSLCMIFECNVSALRLMIGPHAHALQSIH